MSCSGSAQCEGADTVRPTVLPGACVYNLLATITWADWFVQNPTTMVLIQDGIVTTVSNMRRHHRSI